MYHLMLSAVSLNWVTPSLAIPPSLPPSVRRSRPSLRVTAVIQAFQLLRRWKNAGTGASTPGRQLGSPSLTLKTRLPPQRIPLAYRPDPCPSVPLRPWVGGEEGAWPACPPGRCPDP